MKITTPGHLYRLNSFEGSNQQQLQFIEKEPVSEGSTEFKTINDGTTNEEVLAVLIDRLEFLGNKIPSRETSIAKTKCEEALMWLNKRTEDRKKRGVEGKAIL